MHVLIQAEYSLSFLVQPGTECADWFRPEFFSDAVHEIPGMTNTVVETGFRKENILVHTGTGSYPALRLTADVRFRDDLPGKHDVNMLRGRLSAVFRPLMDSLKNRPGCLGAYQIHPAIKITEVVRDNHDNTAEFRKKKKLLSRFLSGFGNV